VTLTNARLPCSEAEQRPSSAVGYRLAFGETREERVIIGDAPPCSDTALTIPGVLKTAELGRIVDLEFPGAPFTSWPKRYQSTLWTASGPDDTKLGLFMMPPFALMGLVVLAFYWRPETPPPPIAALDLDGPIDAWAPSMRVLPVRRLSLASGALFDRVLAWARNAEGNRRPIDDPTTQALLGEAEARLYAVRSYNYRLASEMAHAEPSAALASSAKIFGTDAMIEVCRLLLETLGMGGLYRPGSAASLIGGDVEQYYRKCQINTFGGGTAEVLRDIIAQHGLGTPRVVR
jgi:hypothetical protein